MPGFVLTNQAKADLKSIGRYTSDTWSREQRNRYLAQLDRSFAELAAKPLKGLDCAGVRPGYRKHGVGRRIVFYRSIADDCIEIIRVPHERMDVESRLAEPGAD